MLQFATRERRGALELMVGQSVANYAAKHDLGTSHLSELVGQSFNAYPKFVRGDDVLSIGGVRAKTQVRATATMAVDTIAICAFALRRIKGSYVQLDSLRGMVPNWIIVRANEHRNLRRLLGRRFAAARKKTSGKELQTMSGAW